ncbi:ATP-binding protein [Streptomyces alboflavus]|uniref:ATP-binding protein n=1 Tax=Streptomyces alboflavus TaxID=67267 RepID=UPI0036CA27E4
MINASEFGGRDPWGRSFAAEPSEVAGLRRAVRIKLTLWGLPEAVEAAQTCVTELTSNVIKHVGLGTPVTLTISMAGTFVRIEMLDPDARALPTLLAPGRDAESGRGMALVDAVTEHRWGVVLREASKVVWCELATDLRLPAGQDDPPLERPRVARVEGHLALYGAERSGLTSRSGRLGVAVAEEVAIDLIADLLHWLQAHGCDPDEALDRAQMHFEAEAEAEAGS